MKMIDKNIGMTLIPYLALEELKGTEKMKFVRQFSEPVPTREISVVYHKSQIKKQLIDLLEKEIKESVPKKLLAQNETFLVGTK
jgi:LysR family hydrogen peroxide-inducible transcriptional activator